MGLSSPVCSVSEPLSRRVFLTLRGQRGAPQGLGQPPSWFGAAPFGFGFLTGVLYSHYMSVTYAQGFIKVVCDFSLDPFKAAVLSTLEQIDDLQKSSNRRLFLTF